MDPIPAEPQPDPSAADAGTLEESQMKPVTAEWAAPIQRQAAPGDDARAAVIYIRHHYLPIGRAGSYT